MSGRYAQAMIREVHLDPATDQEVEAVRAVFRAYGFDPELKDDYARRSTGVLPWIIIVTLGTPILAFLRAFGAAVGTAAGQDAYPAFKNLVKDLWASRAGLPATMEQSSSRTPTTRVSSSRAASQTKPSTRSCAWI